METEERPLPELVRDTIDNVREIFRGEVRLAITEAKEEAAKAGRAAIWLVVGAVVGFYALGLFLLTAVYALSTTVPPWLAALIVGAAMAVIAVALVAVGAIGFRQVHAKPEKTILSMRENLQWAKRQPR